MILGIFCLAKRWNDFKFLFYLVLQFGLVSSATALEINIFLTPNGRGLNTTREILKEGLEELGHSVHYYSWEEKRDEQNQADVNIFLERINPQWIPSAKLNWLIPNPESYDQYIGFLRGIDLVLCRTHEVERIFKELGKDTYFLGFTSRDCNIDSIEKNFSSYLHLRGGSIFKGTEVVLEAWKLGKKMPPLTIIASDGDFSTNHPQITLLKKKLSVSELRDLQNSCGVHLCPSSTEGFGHYLSEAMSAEAVVITVDAPPMNEFITDKRCLVPYKKVTKHLLATLYTSDSEGLVNTIKQLRTLSKEELQQIGKNNRAIYLQKSREFYENLQKLSQNSIEYLQGRD